MKRHRQEQCIIPHSESLLCGGYSDVDRLIVLNKVYQLGQHRKIRPLKHLQSAQNIKGVEQRKDSHKLSPTVPQTNYWQTPQ